MKAIIVTTTLEAYFIRVKNPSGDMNTVQFDFFMTLQRFVQGLPQESTQNYNK